VLTIKNTNKYSYAEFEENDSASLEHDIDIAKGIFETKESYRKIVKAGIAQWVKDFQSGHIKISTVDDLKKLIDLDIELQKDQL